MEVIRVRELISELDALTGARRYAEAAELLDAALNKARVFGDGSAELTILSEQMGLYRKTGEEQPAMAAVERGLELLGERGLTDSVTGATVLINAATTMNAFGQPERALPLYERARVSYEHHLERGDYRRAGLYNNMALTCAALGQNARAEELYMLALAALDGNPAGICESAVTYINLAQLCNDRDDREECGSEERVEEYVDRALELLDSRELPRDGYYAFTCEKCAPVCGYLGFFLAERDLKRRAERIYAEEEKK